MLDLLTSMSTRYLLIDNIITGLGSEMSAFILVLFRNA